MMRKYSRKVVWMAMDSEYGARLEQIAQEHTRMARKLITDRDVPKKQREAMAAKIERLRCERNAILDKFVEKHG